MRPMPLSRPFTLGAALVAAVAVHGTVPAHEFRAGAIEVDHPFAPAPPPGAPSLAGYASFTNTGAETDRLVGASAPFAERVEMHSTTLDGDVARMRRLEDGVEIPAGATVALAPGGTHLMFVDPAPGLAVGDALTVTLHFERAGDAEVVFRIEDGVGGAPTSHDGHEGHDM